MPSFIKIVQAVKKLNSISRERLNFRRRPILFTTLYRNIMQANNFGGTFHQLFLWIFSWNFHRRCLSTFSIPWCKKVGNDHKLKSRGSCLKVESEPTAFRALLDLGRSMDGPSLDRSYFSRLQPISFLFFDPSLSHVAKLVARTRYSISLLHTHAELGKRQKCFDPSKWSRLEVNSFFQPGGSSYF